MRRPATPATSTTRPGRSSHQSWSRPRRAPRLKLIWGDGRYRGPIVQTAAEALDLTVEVVTPAKGQKGFQVLPRRAVIERSFAWMARFRRLARDYERLPETLAGLHYLAFAMLMAQRFVAFMVQSA